MIHVQGLSIHHLGTLHRPSLYLDRLKRPNDCLRLTNGFYKVAAESYSLLLVVFRIFTLLTLQFPVDAVGLEFNLIKTSLFFRAIIH